MTSPKFEGVQILKTDGSSQRRLSDEPGAGYRFAWSPDGKRIAFKCRSNDGPNAKQVLKVAAVDGTGVKVLAERPGEVGVPAWLEPDSVGVVLDGKAVVLGLDGRVKETRSTAKAHTMAWAKSQRVQVFTEDDRVVVVGADGKRRELTKPADGRFYDAQIAPAGDRAIVHNLDGHLYLFDLAKGSKTDLGEGHAATFSPDGRSAICNITTDDGEQITSSEIVVIDLASGTRRQMTHTLDRHEMYPAWAPDGKRIAYEDSRSGSIFVQSIEQGEKR